MISITDRGVSSGPISEKEQDKHISYENGALIFANQYRYVTFENHKGETPVFQIIHPVKPSPSVWSTWHIAF